MHRTGGRHMLCATGTPCADGARAVASGCITAVASESTMPLLHTGPVSRVVVKNDTHTFGLWALAPVVNGWVFLGDLARYVPASAKRFPALGPTKGLAVRGT